LPEIDQVTASPSGSVALGWKVQAWPALTVPEGVPVTTGAALAEVVGALVSPLEAGGAEGEGAGLPEEEAGGVPDDAVSESDPPQAARVRDAASARVPMRQP